MRDGGLVLGFVLGYFGHLSLAPPKRASERTREMLGCHTFWGNDR